MIKILTGKIGAGKTLQAMGIAYRHLLEGKTLCTNVEVVYPVLAALGLKEHGKLIERDQIIELDLNEIPEWNTSIPWGVPGHPVLVILDEIHLFFNSRDWAKTDKHHRGMVSFLSQSRKACVDIIFVAQELKDIE